MHSRKIEIGGLVAFCVILGGCMFGCGSDPNDGVIRPLPSNKGGISSAQQHHPGQVATPPVGGGQPGGQAPNQGQ
jgi:hypothetical protein